MGAYVGAGGMLLHLAEPLDPLYAKQLAKGDLRPATVEEEAGQAPSRPASSAGVGQWRDWAVETGMPKHEAMGMSKKQLMEYAESLDEDKG